MRIEPHLEALAAQAIADALGTEAPAVLRPTQDPKHGDYQVNGVLGLAKRLKKNPRELAALVAERLATQPTFASAEVAGPGFVNLRLDDAWVAEQLGAMLNDRAREGVPTVEKPERIVVDYSGPNIAKQMHVGHLRSTIIGAALVELLRFAGHEVIGDNHLGDWGTQFGLLIAGMRAFGDEAALESDSIAELERIYREASQRAKDDEAFAAVARAELKKLQDGDPENRALWQRFVAVTRASLDVIYDRLGITFDQWLGESAYDDRLAGVVAELIDKGIARVDDGAVCVFFNELEGVTGSLANQTVPYIVQKRDGAYLYATSDIATVEYRRDQFQTERAIYVVDKRQGNHFQQLFEVIRLLGIDMRLEHVGFGTVLGEDGKAIKTRDGKAITLLSLLDEAEERAVKLMTEQMSHSDESARGLAAAVGLGAVKYADLCQNRTSDYKFAWDKMISLDGNCGPYIQYAHARCCSILARGEVAPESLDGTSFELAHELEQTLARRLLKLADVVHTAGEQCLPHFVTDHLYALARDYSRFHEGCPVLKSEATTRTSRLALVDLTRRQLRLGLGLLGIEAPEQI